MTKWQKTTVCCPACLTEGDFNIPVFIDIEEDPDLKEDIFNRNIFKFTCPECGEEILVSYGLTYLDNDKNFMVTLIPDKEELTMDTTCYLLRVVRSINEFVEKIALMEDGIDDRVVELYKIMLEDQFEEERQGSEILGIYYGGQNSGDKSLLFYIITANSENCRASLSFDTYSAIEAQFEKILSTQDDEPSEINRMWAIETLKNDFSEDKE